MRRTQKLVLGAFVLLPLLAGVALATPGIGIISAPVWARGTHAEELNVHSKAGVKLQTKSPVDFVTQQIRIAPGGSTGWHSHPGPVLVTVKAGALTIVYASDPDCVGRTYGVGESFVDRGDENVHNAFNRTNVELELWATYLVPGAAGSPARLDEADPGICSS
jgi:hypothetical protein